MNKPSRYVRPVQPTTGLIFQPRDYAILEAVYKHRYMYSDHIHQLLFCKLTLKVAQVRLRKLWVHGYLERYYIPFILDGHSLAPPRANQPFYGLGYKGADLLSDRLNIPVENISYNTPKSPTALSQLQHHLLATDFLVSLQVACQTRSDIEVKAIENELVFWRKLRLRHNQSKNCLVPDAAVTLHYPKLNQTMTFYLEIVKAGSRSGNKTLLQKLHRYAKLHHQQRFFHDYEHQNLRAVVIATTSEQRANGFLQMSKKLIHGRGLFWFGTFNQTNNKGQTVSSLTPETILQPRWQDASEKRWSLLCPNNKQ